MGGLLSAMGVRHVLSKGVAGYTRPMEPALCEALMKRINPTEPQASIQFLARYC